MHVAYGCGSVLLWQGDEIPRGRAVFFPIDNALYSITFGTHTKTAELIEMLFGIMSGQCVTWGDDPGRGRVNLWENMPDKPDTPMNCDLDWSMQRCARNQGRCLIASIGQLLAAKRGWDCTPWVKSDVYDCLVEICFMARLIVRDKGEGRGL